MQAGRRAGMPMDGCMDGWMVRFVMLLINSSMKKNRIFEG